MADTFEHDLLIRSAARRADQHRRRMALVRANERAGRYARDLILDGLFGIPMGTLKHLSDFEDAENVEPEQPLRYPDFNDSGAVGGGDESSSTEPSA